MNKLVLFALSIAAFPVFFSCGNEEKKTVSADVVANPATAEAPADSDNLPKFQWEKEVHDFGIIQQGERVAYSFKFTNVGKSDLIIASAKGSCGCTVPEFSSEPVKPGGTGKIDVVFDSEGKSGHQDKTVTVMANTNPNTVVLRITGQVEVPKLEK